MLVSIITFISSYFKGDQLSTLTTGVDTVPNDGANQIVFGTTVNAGTGTTLNVFDTFNTGSGTDTLNLNMASTAMAMSGANIPVLNSVEIINLSNLNGTTSLVASLAADMTTFSASNAVTGNANLVTLTEVGANAKTFSYSNITGTGSNIAITTAAGVNGGTADAYTINLAGVQAGPTTANATDSADIAILGAAAGFGVESLTINTASNSQIGALTVYSTGTTASLNTLILNGAGQLTVFGTTQTLATGTVTINASGSTGGVDIGVGANTLVFTGGTANDILRITAAGAFTAADTVNFGTGTADTLFLADTSIGQSGDTVLNAAINAIASLDVLGVSANATVDMSRINVNNLSLGAGANTRLINLLASDNVLVNGVTTGTIDATAALGFNTVNLALNQDAFGVAATGTLNVTGNSSINISSNSTGSATTANTIGAVTNSANAVFTLTGSQALTITSFSAVATAVNGSAMTGILTATGGNAASALTGGSRADVLTGATVAGGDSLVGGAGNDTLNTAVITTGLVTTSVTGGLGADAINIRKVSVDVGALVTVRATAAESFATTGQFDTVTYSDKGALGTVITTLVTGQLSSTIVGIAQSALQIGSTAVVAGSFLAAGSTNGTLTATDQNFQIYQDSNANGIIDSTDLRVDFTNAAVDTMSVELVGGQVVVTSIGLA